MDLELAGKLTVVTGGSRGLGRAIATELAAEGARVIIAGRSLDALKRAAEEISGDVIPMACDTTSDKSVEDLMTAASKTGNIEVLVNCAALQPTGPVPKLPELDVSAIWPDINTKVLGYLRCIRAVLPHMAHQGHGRIINISGMNARITGSITGSLRNAAVVAMSKAIADEVRGSGVSVVTVHPWVTRTERTAQILADRAAAAGVTIEEVEADLANGNLLGRLVTGREIAYIVAFLASPKSAAINGDVVPAGGGMPGAISY